MKVYLRFIPMAAVMGMIFYLSHQPGDFIRLPQISGIDKLAHTIAYACLAGASLHGLQPYTRESNRKAVAILVVSFCLLFGISDEFHQSFIPGRSVSSWDVVADTVGALLVVGWWYRLASGQGLKNYP